MCIIMQHENMLTAIIRMIIYYSRVKKNRQSYVEIKSSPDFLRTFGNFRRIVKWMLMLTAFRCSNNSDLTRALSLYSWTEVPFKSVFHGFHYRYLCRTSLRHCECSSRFERVVNNCYFEIRILVVQLCNNCARVTMTSVPLTMMYWVFAALYCKEVKELPV